MLIFVVISYLFSFFTNLVISIKYPDGEIELYQLFLSVLFFTSIFLYVDKESKKNKINNKLKYFLIIGFFSGLITFILSLLEMLISENVVFESIYFVHYFLYGLFITPFFGLNLLLDVNYGFFSLITSVVYFVIYVIYISLYETNNDK